MISIQDIASAIFPVVNLYELLQHAGNSPGVAKLKKQCMDALMIWGHLALEALGKDARTDQQLITIDEWVAMEQTSGTDYRVRRILASHAFDFVFGCFKHARNEHESQLADEAVENQRATRAALCEVLLNSPDLLEAVKKMLAEDPAKPASPGNNSQR